MYAIRSYYASLHETPFTVSVDLIGQGCTTGISAHDRYKTIVSLTDLNTKPSDLGRPGHIFPLKANKDGVLRRAGHTEAAIDLTRLAGLYPAGVLVEIMNDDVITSYSIHYTKLYETVSHAKFGQGKVLKIEGEFPQTKALVEFDSVGQKNLLLKFAKLEVVQK